jgi:hypothetical protein
MKSLNESPTVRASRYGRLEGRYFVGARQLANQTLELTGLFTYSLAPQQHVSQHQTTTTGALGGFVFDRVIPMDELRVRRVSTSKGSKLFQTIVNFVHVESGQTTLVKLGGVGRAVVGRVAPPPDWKGTIDFTDECAAGVESNRPIRPYPVALFRGKRPAQHEGSSNWFAAWRHSPEGMAYEEGRIELGVGLQPDGTFRIDDLPAGEYRLVVRTNEGEYGRVRGPFARTMREFTMPEMPEGRSDVPLDLGTVVLVPRATLNPGDPAPGWEVKTVDGVVRRLTDYRGRFLVLDFGVTWNEQSRFQIAQLNELYERFRGDKRVDFLSFVLGADSSTNRAFVAEKGESWPQALIGPLSNPLATAYDVEDRNVPVAILVGPDGKVLAIDRYAKLGEVIKAELARPAR